MHRGKMGGLPLSLSAVPLAPLRLPQTSQTQGALREKSQVSPHHPHQRPRLRAPTPRRNHQPSASSKSLVAYKRSLVNDKKSLYLVTYLAAPSDLDFDAAAFRLTPGWRGARGFFSLGSPLAFAFSVSQVIAVSGRYTVWRIFFPASGLGRARSISWGSRTLPG